jgi:hypothetical protein
MFDQPLASHLSPPRIWDRKDQAGHAARPNMYIQYPQACSRMGRGLVQEDPSPFLTCNYLKLASRINTDILP